MRKLRREPVPLGVLRESVDTDSGEIANGVSIGRRRLAINAHSLSTARRLQPYYSSFTGLQLSDRQTENQDIAERWRATLKDLGIETCVLTARGTSCSQATLSCFWRLYPALRRQGWPTGASGEGEASGARP